MISVVNYLITESENKDVFPELKGKINGEPVIYSGAFGNF